ncbi:MAG: EAL domain-containing protein [Dehalococcoidia bacterium]
MTNLRDDPHVSGYVITLRDISHRHRMRMTERFLSEASAVLASSLDYQTTLSKVARLAVPQFADWCAVDIVEPNGAVSRLAVAATDPDKERLVREVRRNFPLSPDASAGAPAVIRTGEPEVVRNVGDDVLMNGATSAAHLDLLRRLKMESYLRVPLTAHGRTLGVMSWIYSGSGRHYDDADLGPAMEVARRAALAIDNARLYEEARQALMARDEALAEAERERDQLRQILAVMPTGVTIFDRNGDVTTVNDAGAALLPRGTHGIREFSRIYHPRRPNGETFAPASTPVGRTLAAGEVVRGEPVVLRHPDSQSDITLLVNSAPLRDAGGEISGAMIVYQDITRLQAVETALRQTEAQLRSVVTHLPVVLFAADANGVYTLSEGKGLTALGRHAAEVVGMSAFDVWRSVPAIQQNFRDALAGREFSGPVEVGDTVFDARGGPLWDEHGAICGVVGVATDITDRVRAERALVEAEGRLRMVVANAPVILFAVDRHGVLTLVEGLGLARMGLTPSALVGQSVFEMFAAPPELVDGFRRGLAGEGVSVTIDLFDRTLDVRGGPVRDASGAIVGAVGVATDITDHVQAQSDLSRTTHTLQTLNDGSPLAIVTFDREGAIDMWNPAAQRIFGLSRGQIVGRPLSALPFRRLPDVRALFESVLDGGHEADTETVAYCADGAPLDLSVWAAPLRDAQDAVTGVIMVITDITERKRFEAQLAHQAFYDLLTGLPNRALLKDRIVHACAGASARGQHVSVLFADLDNFKVINDSLGHGAGDRLLMAVADRLRRAVQPGDTVSRLGGDEFTIVIDRGTDERAAVALAGHLLERMAAPFIIDGREIFATMSIGIAVCDGSTESPEELLRNADLAMYEAKARGRAGYALHHADMNERMRRRLSLETELRRAVDNGDIIPYYQPIVDLASGAIVGVEALARWQHPKRGLVPPSEFIPIAEENGLILQIGERITDLACRQVARWRNAFDCTGLVLSVNLSAREFQSVSLASSIRAALERSGLPFGALNLEITESIMMQDGEAALTTLTDLRALGVTLAIDDFGTGYSSLSYLRRLPVDTLKIDQSFIAAMGDSAGGDAIVEATAALAHALGLQVTAEGIETADQASAARTLGCDRGQGYLFARPLTAADLTRLLAHTAAPESVAATG